jgi:hypothetical protein
MTITPTTGAIQVVAPHLFATLNAAGAALTPPYIAAGSVIDWPSPLNGLTFPVLLVWKETAQGMALDVCTGRIQYFILPYSEPIQNSTILDWAARVLNKAYLNSPYAIGINAVQPVDGQKARYINGMVADKPVPGVEILINFRDYDGL